MCFCCQKSKKASKKRKTIKLAPELSNAVNYCTAVHFPDLGKSKKEGESTYKLPNIISDRNLLRTVKGCHVDILRFIFYGRIAC